MRQENEMSAKGPPNRVRFHPKNVMSIRVASVVGVAEAL